MALSRPMICASLALAAPGLALPAALADGHGAHSARHGAHHEAAQEDVPSTSALLGSDGAQIGALMLEQGPHGLVLRVEVAAGGLSPGWHGLHLHQIGDCSDPGSYTRSGGHVGKRAGGHGLMNPDGMESGDLPNIWAAEDGSAGYEAFTGQTDLASLKDDDGSALIIHAGPDDHSSQPIGHAGARVACAVIQ